MTIGEKIKKRRKELGLTQNAVAGDKISRNMLSLIEGGNASPSLDTLYYIAEKLKIRIEYLVSEDLSLDTFERLDTEEKISRLYHSNKYEDIVYLIDNIRQKTDFIIFLGAECSYKVAREKVRSGSLVTAKKWLSKTAYYSEMTSMDTTLLDAKCSLLSSILENIQSPKLNFNQEEYESKISKVVDEEFYHYYLCDFEYNYQHPILRLHIEAKNFIKSRNYTQAILKLTEAEEKKNQENYDAFVFFGIYTDLENCYKELFDFEKAYRYATKKISLMEYFKT